MDDCDWETVLTQALSAGEPVVVIDAVRAQLGHEPTSAALNAARRAAHRLAQAGTAAVSRIRQPVDRGRTRQVLTLSPAGTTDTRSELAPRRGRPRSETQVARTVINAVTSAGHTVDRLDLSRITATVAADLADQLRWPIGDLTRF